MQAGINAFLKHPAARRRIIVLALVLVLPSLWAGLLADDYVHLLRLSQPDLFPPSHYPAFFDLFVFINDDALWRQQQYAYNLLPWWTSDQVQLVFFRPLSELTHWLDSRFLLPHTGLLHAHSLLWYLALLIVLSVVYGRLFADKKPALLALLLFAVDATHGFTVAWLANRNALLAGFFVLLSLWFFIQARQASRTVPLLLSSFFLLLALLSAETGISGIAFLLAYTVLLDTRQGFGKYTALLPAAMVVIVWLAFYRYYGFGASGSYYLDPFTDFTAYLQHLPLRFFTAVAMQFNVLPLHLMDRYPQLVALIGALIFIMLLLFVRHSKSKLALYWLAVFCMAVLPVTVAVVQERNLLIAGFAGCALLAMVVLWLWQQPSTLWQWLATLLVVFHVVFSALIMPLMSYAPAVPGKSAYHTAMSMPPQWLDKPVLAIGVPLFDAAFLVPVRLWHGQAAPVRFWNLSSCTEGLQISELAENQWQLHNASGLFSKEDALLRDFQRQPLQPGQVLDVNGAHVTIQQVADNGQVSSIIFSLPLTQTQWQWAQWHEGQWQAFEPQQIINNNDKSEAQ